MAHPGRGPPLVSSKTWCGFSSFRKLQSSSRPLRPPLLGFTNTRRGQQSGGSFVCSTSGSTNAVSGRPCTAVSLASMYSRSASAKQVTSRITAPTTGGPKLKLDVLCTLPTRYPVRCPVCPAPRSPEKGVSCPPHPKGIQGRVCPMKSTPKMSQPQSLSSVTCQPCT